MRLFDELLLLSLHLKTALLHLYGSLLHSSLVIQVVSSIEHIRPLVLLALFELLSLLVGPRVDLVLRGQFVHLFFLISWLL